MTPAEERRFVDGLRALNEGEQDAAWRRWKRLAICPMPPGWPG